MADGTLLPKLLICDKLIVEHTASGFTFKYVQGEEVMAEMSLDKHLPIGESVVLQDIGIVLQVPISG